MQETETADYCEEIYPENLSVKKYSRRMMLVNIFLFSLISYFGAEILTGSTSVEGILKYPISAIEGIIFYGFQVSIIADISIRFKLNFGTIYLLGLIYGILEEGFALFTMESTATHTLWLSLIGLNVTWTIYIMLFHAIITVCSTIVIVHIISEDTLREPFLNATTYTIMLLSLGIIYYTFIYGSIKAGRTPEPISLIILLLITTFLTVAAFLDKRNHILKNKVGSIWVPGIDISLIMWAIALGVPIIVGNRVSWLLGPVTIFLVICVIYFYIFFHYMNPDINNHRSLLLFYSTFNAVLLLFGTFNRTIISDFLAVSGLIFLIYSGFKKVI